MPIALRALVASLALVAGTIGADAQETTIKIGLVKSISNVANLWAMEKGYFKEVGIKLVPEDLDKIIDDAYAGAGLHPDNIDTGAVILTGEALRRENAEGIAKILSEQGGEF